MTDQFATDVHTGLTTEPKELPSKYFYDAEGDELFVKIMHSPEYYLTRSELEIFEKQADQIIESFGQKTGKFFELIELGAGDGLKTRELLSALNRQGYEYEYLPVDISKHALDELKDGLKRDFPDLPIRTQQGDYFEILKSLKDSPNPKVVLFLGSNIGNLTDQLAAEFIYGLGANMHSDDRLLIGVDLIKSEEIVMPAYNDKDGVTRDFNLNLLSRINRELGGNFNIDRFKHVPMYSMGEGIAQSFLESTEDQYIDIAETGQSYHFSKGERIHTEISRKYNDEIILNITRYTDFVIERKFTDERDYFADYIFKRC